MAQQPPAIAAALMSGRDRDIDNQQMIVLLRRLDHSDQGLADQEKIDPVIADRLVVIGEHRQWLATDDRDHFA